MTNVLTIARREFSVYFESIIGYLYIIIFLLITVGLFMTPFFTFPAADMRNFFDIIPLTLCIFISAATMRLWSEERKENTFEMLMTLPMKTYEVVIGKYAGALVFYSLALAATLVVPIMLMFLGRPDVGQIFTSYIGALLLGAMLISVGIFISGLFSDQITAFIVSLLVCFAMFLVGTEFLEAYLDGIISGFGSLVGEIFGFASHYVAFERGVIDATHVLYFLSWTALFLFFNGFYLEIRNRPGLRYGFSAALVLILAVGLILNWILADLNLGHIDMTEGRIHTVSEGAKKILAKLKVPVRVKVYVTPRDKMPSELKTLQRTVTDKLDELKLASNGKIAYDVVYMEAANVMEASPDDNNNGNKKNDKEEAIERRMLEKGLKPFSVQAIREDSVVNVLVYSAIGIAYKDLKEEIIPKIVPQNIHELEYLVVSSIYKMTRDKVPSVVLAAPKEAVKIPPMMRKYYEQMGQQIPESEDPYTVLEEMLRHEKYDVTRVEITKESPLPAAFDTLVIINPRDLNDRQKFEINKAIVEGRNVFLAVQKYMWDYGVDENGIRVSKAEETPNIDDLLKHYGVTVSSDILMDENHQPVSISDPRNPLAMLVGGGVTLNLPIQIVLSQDSMNQDVSITSRLSNLFYLWGAALDVDKEATAKTGLKLTTLMTTSARAWTVKPTQLLNQNSFSPPTAQTDAIKRYPVAVMLAGQFPNAYADKPMPEWPATDENQTQQPPQQTTEAFKDYKQGQSKLILVGGTQMFKKDLLRRPTLDFFLNSIDALSLGEDMIDVRAKKLVDRTIAPPSKGVRTFWKFVNYFLINAIIAAICLIVIARKKRQREAYLASVNGGGTI